MQSCPGPGDHRANNSCHTRGTVALSSCVSLFHNCDSRYLGQVNSKHLSASLPILALQIQCSGSSSKKSAMCGGQSLPSSCELPMQGEREVPFQPPSHFFLPILKDLNSSRHAEWAWGLCCQSRMFPRLHFHMRLWEGQIVPFCSRDMPIMSDVLSFVYTTPSGGSRAWVHFPKEQHRPAHHPLPSHPHQTSALPPRLISSSIAQRR